MPFLGALQVHMLELPADPAQIPDIIVYLVSGFDGTTTNLHLITFGTRVAKLCEYQVSSSLLLFQRNHSSDPPLPYVEPHSNTDPRYSRVSSVLCAHPSGRCARAEVPRRPILVRNRVHDYVENYIARLDTVVARLELLQQFLRPKLLFASCVSRIHEALIIFFLLFSPTSLPRSDKYAQKPFEHVRQELVADKTRQGLWAVGSDNFPGSLLIRLGLGRDAVARHNPWKEVELLSQVRIMR